MGVTIGAGTAYPSGVHRVHPFYVGFVLRDFFFFSIMFCRSLFVLFLLAIVLSVL
jgi:hypothetical protein